MKVGRGKIKVEMYRNLAAHSECDDDKGERDLNPA
jgi:hypothetical protein